MTTDEQRDPGHGNSPAAWTAVIIILVAFTIGTLAFWFDVEGYGTQWLVWASAGLVVLGFVVGGILKAAGYGVGGARVKSKH
ncbi:MAG: hypothetical protein J7480_06565 [Microbacteriaceae bacterium]|nr:hypothetical protein [Microbacteriaceae bacterium]